MYDENKVKTFTPVLSVGKGGTSLKSEDALFDILLALNEENCSEEPFSDSKLQSIARSLVELTGMDDWIDGEYTIFDNYKIIIKTMTVSRFEGLPEFSGFEQIKFETAYKHRVPFFTEELLDKGCTEILITKVDDGWDLVGKKPINYDE